MLAFTRIAFLLMAFAIGPCTAQAAVPRELNYQGFLTAPGGTPVNASVNMVFKLYTVASGGTEIYSETQNSVPVVNGVFNVLIGSVTSIPGTVSFDQPYYLGVTVGADAEMAPRQLVAASAYSIRSATTDALAPAATVPASQISGAIGTATNFTGNLAGDVTGTQGATVIAASTVTGKTLTGFASGAGPISATGSTSPVLPTRLNVVASSPKATVATTRGLAVTTNDAANPFALDAKIVGAAATI